MAKNQFTEHCKETESEFDWRESVESRKKEILGNKSRERSGRDRKRAYTYTGAKSFNNRELEKKREECEKSAHYCKILE